MSNEVSRWQHTVMSVFTIALVGILCGFGVLFLLGAGLNGHFTAFATVMALTSYLTVEFRSLQNYMEEK